MLRYLPWLALVALEVKSSLECVKAINITEVILSASLYEHPPEHIWMLWAAQSGFGGEYLCMREQQWEMCDDVGHL